MASEADFHTLDLYRTSAEMTSFIYDLEDRFPTDELSVLYARLRAAAVDVGARIAEGFGRDGLDKDGRVSGETARGARAKLCELRHYILTSQSRFFLDEVQVGAFEDLYQRIHEALGPREGEA